MKTPKKYTAKLSRKDKTKQKKYLRKSQRQYKKGNYYTRPKLKSFTNKKFKSNWRSMWYFDGCFVSCNYKK